LGGSFQLDKATSDDLHRRIATGQAIESGHFRGEGGANLRGIFAAGLEYLLNEVTDPGWQALPDAPFAIRAQFYFDGNCTARCMMNGRARTSETGRSQAEPRPPSETSRIRTSPTTHA
jgi:hypothetical protein